MGDEMDIMIVIGEDGNYSSPTIAYCLDYAESHSVDPARTFMDNTGWGASRSWGSTFDAIDNYSGGGVGLPWSAILDGRGMNYVYSDAASASNPYDVVDELMAAE